jgi:tetratricopeptide (TPR) repeat protein
MAIYILALCRQRAGDEAGRREALARAAAMPPGYCFPQRLESVPALEAAMAAAPDDARAPYYLGLFCYAHRRHAKAIALWERATALDPDFPTVWRNLGLRNRAHCRYMIALGQLGLGDHAAARAAFDAVLEIDPNHQGAMVHRDMTIT